MSQREIGLDAPNYHVALRAALRQDPDVVLIGEVRDEETAMTALRAAETGHLVLCTLHTIDAAETVHRFVDLFGERQTMLARQMLAATLIGVCSQRLISAEKGGRILNAEVLVNSARLRDLIAEGATQTELRTAIGEGEYYGMHTFDQDLMRLVRAGDVEESVAVGVATNPHDFKLLLSEVHSRAQPRAGSASPRRELPPRGILPRGADETLDITSREFPLQGGGSLCEHVFVHGRVRSHPPLPAVGGSR